MRVPAVPRFQQSGDEMGSDPHDAGPERPEWAGYTALCWLNARLERMLALAAGGFLALFTVVVLIDVIYRQVLAQPMMWPSEWSVMAFVWSVLLGAAVSASRQSHFVVVMLPDLTGRWEQLLKLLVGALSLLFAVILLYFGWRMALSGTRRFTPMMGYSMVYVFAAFPVAGVAFVLFTVEQIIAALLGYTPRHESETEGRVA